MRKLLTRLFRRNTTTTEQIPSDETPATDYLVLLQLEDGADPVPMTLGDLLECDTKEKLLRRAAEKTGDARATTKRRPRPDPADFKGRPIRDYLEARGVPENTSRYTTESGITTLYYRFGPGGPRRRSSDGR